MAMQVAEAAKLAIAELGSQEISVFGSDANTVVCDEWLIDYAVCKPWFIESSLSLEMFAQYDNFDKRK